jgi:hypothetical protein
VAEARGQATIDNRTGRLRLRCVRYDDEGDLVLNEEPDRRHLAVIVPRTYLEGRGE